MTSEEAKAKAAELANGAGPPDYTYWSVSDYDGSSSFRALADYIQYVSDACREVDAQSGRSLYTDVPAARALLAPFILPGAKDELLDALNNAMPGRMGCAIHSQIADGLRDELAKRGLKIVKADQ